VTTDLRPQHRLPRGGGNCDFCGIGSVTLLYACRNFDWEGRPVFYSPVGRWASCHVCADLIEGKDWGRLNRRVMREVTKRKGLTPADIRLLRQSLKKLHASFVAHLVLQESLFVHISKYRRLTVAEAAVEL